MPLPFDIAGMGGKTQSMLRDSIDALVNMDSALAVEVCRRDDEVDRIKYEIRVGVEEQIRQQPEKVRPLLRAAGRLPQSRAHRRLRHEHRRGRDLHVRRPHHPPRPGRVIGGLVGRRLRKE